MKLISATDAIGSVVEVNGAAYRDGKWCTEVVYISEFTKRQAFAQWFYNLSVDHVCEAIGTVMSRWGTIEWGAAQVAIMAALREAEDSQEFLPCPL